MRMFEPSKVFAGFLAILFLMGGNVLTAHAGGRSCKLATFNFHWGGQIAGFMVNGRFSYNKKDVPANGIVREENLLSLDVSFYDPHGNLLRTYADNHKSPVDENGVPYLNFAFDTITEQILQTGSFDVDDDNRRYRNGFTMGEGTPALRSSPGSQTGLNFWTRSNDNSPPHLHVDDWNDGTGAGEFGFPIGYSSHEDIAFLTRTTQDLIDTPGTQPTGSKVGATYYDEAAGVDELASHPEEIGQRVQVVRAKVSFRDYLRCRRGH